MLLCNRILLHPKIFLTSSSCKRDGFTWKWKLKNDEQKSKNTPLCMKKRLLWINSDYFEQISLAKLNLSKKSFLEKLKNVQICKIEIWKTSFRIKMSKISSSVLDFFPSWHWDLLCYSGICRRAIGNHLTVRVVILQWTIGLLNWNPNISAMLQAGLSVDCVDAG